MITRVLGLTMHRGLTHTPTILSGSLYSTSPESLLSPVSLLEVFAAFIFWVTGRGLVTVVTFELWFPIYTIFYPPEVTVLPETIFFYGLYDVHVMLVQVCHAASTRVDELPSSCVVFAQDNSRLVFNHRVIPANLAHKGIRQMADMSQRDRSWEPLQWPSMRVGLTRGRGYSGDWTSISLDVFSSY